MGLYVLDAIRHANIVHDISNEIVVGKIIQFDANQLNDLLKGPVKDIILDTKGKSEIENLLTDCHQTDFEFSLLQEILDVPQTYEGWFIGETIAEVFLNHVGNCEYPWPTSRDLKNKNASPAGCDLTGLQRVDDESFPYRFSFGEVKTSEDTNSPPSVMQSLSDQLFGLRDEKEIKHQLFLYLAHHAVNKEWYTKFQSAASRYLKSEGQDVAIYGILVRDTQPNVLDIRAKVRSLAKNCPDNTTIELYALHIPLCQITNLPTLFNSVI